MYKQMDSIQAVTTAARDLQGVLQKIITKQDNGTANGTIRALRQVFNVACVPEDILELTAKIK